MVAAAVPVPERGSDPVSQGSLHWGHPGVAFASVSLQGLQCQAPGLALPQHSVGLTLAAT